MNDERPKVTAEEAIQRANEGIIGISPLHPDTVFDGYDGILTVPGSEYQDDIMSYPELVRLADKVIALWQERRAEWAAKV